MKVMNEWIKMDGGIWHFYDNKSDVNNNNDDSNNNIIDNNYDNNNNNNNSDNNNVKDDSKNCHHKNIYKIQFSSLPRAIATWDTR